MPRPIGWITTLSATGVVNLAPFSFFNLLSYDPPFVMFSAGSHEEDGGKKDSVVNVEATGEFVYNMATWAQKDQMNETARIVARDVDEMEAAGLEPLPSRLVRPPRVKGSPGPLRVPAAPDGDAARPQAVVGASRRHRPGRRRAHRRCRADRRWADRHRQDPADRPARLQDYASIDAMFQMAKRTPEDSAAAR